MRYRSSRYSSYSPASTATTEAGPIASPHSSGPRGWLRPSTMPASMSSGEPTPSPSAKHASLTSWATIRPSTSPGASPTHSTWRPIDAKNASAARAAASEVVGLRVSSTRPPSGAAAKKPAALPSGSSSASGPSSTQDHLRPALERRVVLVVAAAVDDQRGDAVALHLPAGRLGGLAQLVGQRRPAADHHEAVAAASGGSGSGGRCSPSSGYSYQPRPVLRPWSPDATLRAASIEGRQRGSPNDCA